MLKKQIILLLLLSLYSNFNYSINNIEESKSHLIKSKKKKKKSKKNLLKFKKDNHTLKFSLTNTTEAFYGRSVALFSPSPLDQIFYLQTTLDFSADANICKIIKSEVTIRNKGVWGNPNSILQTSENLVKLSDSKQELHNHFFGKQLFWIRNGWVEILINKAFRFRPCLKHYLKFGAFSFSLGRGISLGDAYAVSPGLLGFYSDNIIDQYASGILLHGGIIKKKLDYDFYYAVLSNLSDSFENVNSKIFLDEIGKKNKPARGFGKLNYLLASRLKWKVFESKKSCKKKLTLEPYILYNRDPEQKIEFKADAISELITAGLSCEYIAKKFEFGFEFAQNFGDQRVRGWDRNNINIVRDIKGDAVYAYTQITDKNKPILLTDKKAIVTQKNKKIVDESPQSQVTNGKEIDKTKLFNDISRFRASYKNKYKGFMFVSDASYKLRKNLKIALTFAIASGDENPNKSLDDPNDSNMDGEYQGFIPLQEIYTGKRVRSVFVIGENAISRPLSFPSFRVPEDEKFASNVSGFTNLIFFGAGIDWNFCRCCKKFRFRSNIIDYWQDFATKKFDKKLKKTINEFANKHLGYEINFFADVKLLKNLKAYLIFGFFVPGQHFKDIEGKPLNAENLENLDKINKTNVHKQQPPVLGTHTATILNFGFEFSF